MTVANSRGGKWIRRVGAATLVVASVLGCAGGCRDRQPAQRPPQPTPVLALAAPSTTDVVGVWRVIVNGDAIPILLVFWPGGILGTSDPSYGVWTSRPGGAEGTWETPVAGLAVTYIVRVDGDNLTGSGVVFDLSQPGSSPYPLQLAGSRLKVDRVALGAVVAPGPS